MHCCCQLWLQPKNPPTSKLAVHELPTLLPRALTEAKPACCAPSNDVSPNCIQFRRVVQAYILFAISDERICIWNTANNDMFDSFSALFTEKIFTPIK